ncbi:MAG: beta-ketoacyl synthase chain length factor [Flavihumibacter sp.]
MYLQAASCISAQASFAKGALTLEDTSAATARLPLMEPDYTKLVDPKLIRRMSRIIRMGVATAMAALHDAGLTEPDAILMGTAYGCLDDTGVFLKKMVENREEMLTPTAFIQSTHNTVAAQIALLLKCHAYNNTYVQRQLSFQSALLDACLLLQEHPAQRVLVGAADECTVYSETILRRFHVFKHLPPAEGAACFVLGAEKTPGSLARLKGVDWLFTGADTDLPAMLNALMKRTGEKPDLLLVEADAADTSGIPSLNYKRYTGEYPTSAGFACWLAGMLLAGRELTVDAVSLPGNLQHIWIPVHDVQTHQTAVIRLEAC